MRTTVGPLPPGVYWRRRAAVLGAVLLAVLILYVSCSGGDKRDRPGAGPGLGPGTSPTSVSPAPDPSFEDAVPGTDPSLPSPDEITGSSGTGTGTGTGTDGGASNGGANTGGANNGGANGGVDSGGANAGGVNGGANNGGANNGGINAGTGVPGSDVAAASGGQCTDTEMAVTPVPGRTAAQRGAPIDIRLLIRNVAPRTCARDVGADLQEIYIKQGARKVWSSDTCSTAKGSKVLQFTANYEADYGVTWNGRESSRCSDGLAVGPVPPPGDYEVFGRLGGKISAPIKLTLS